METKMTVKELSKILNVSERVIQKHASDMGLTQNGIQTVLDEWAVIEIKNRIRDSGRKDLANVCEVKNITTDIEMIQKAKDFMAWAIIKIQEETEKRIQAERKNAILTHVTKTYTASEIAKEIGFRSAQELNQAMADFKIQYKQNGTWLPCAQYSDRGLFEIKQQELDNGKVIYDRRITQLGREFLLEQFKDEFNAGKMQVNK
jgi:phage antirepressor YoqD-like protein